MQNYTHKNVYQSYDQKVIDQAQNELTQGQPTYSQNNQLNIIQTRDVDSVSMTRGTQKRLQSESVKKYVKSRDHHSINLSQNIVNEELSMHKNQGFKFQLKELLSQKDSIKKLPNQRSLPKLRDLKSQSIYEYSNQVVPTNKIDKISHRKENSLQLPQQQMSWEIQNKKIQQESFDSRNIQQNQIAQHISQKSHPEQMQVRDSMNSTSANFNFIKKPQFSRDQTSEILNQSNQKPPRGNQYFNHVSSTANSSNNHPQSASPMKNLLNQQQDSNRGVTLKQKLEELHQDQFGINQGRAKTENTPKKVYLTNHRGKMEAQADRLSQVLKTGDLEYLKKQLFHKKKNQQRMASLGRDMNSIFSKNQANSLVNSQLEDFLEYYKSRSPPFQSNEIQQDDNLLTQSQKELISLTNYQAYTSSNQVKKVKQGVQSIVTDSISTEDQNKHQHVYEFLRNAIQKFDPNTSTKLSEISSDLWKNLMKQNNFNSSVRNQDAPQNIKALDQMGQGFHVQSYQSNSSSNLNQPTSLQQTHDSTSTTQNPLHQPILHQKRQSQSKQQQEKLPKFIDAVNKFNPQNPVNKYNWISDSKQKRFKKKMQTEQNVTDLMKKTTQKLELRATNVIFCNYESGQGSKEYDSKKNANQKQSKQDSIFKRDSKLSQSPQKLKEIQRIHRDEELQLNCNQTQNSFTNTKINTQRDVANSSQKLSKLKTQNFTSQIKEQKLIVELKPSIKILHVDDSKVIDSKINLMLVQSNHLLKLTSKIYQTNQNIQITSQDLKLIKKCGLQVPKNTDLAHYIRSREFCGLAREKALQLLCLELQKENDVPSKTTQDINFSTQYAKFFVGFGNNYPLVRSILKNRWWMSMGERANYEDCQLIWTSWKKQKFLDQLLKFEEFQLQEQQFHIKKIYARMEDNYHLANKKGLLFNLQEFYRSQNLDIFESHVFPQTFLIRNSSDDEDYFRLIRYIQENPDTVWIIKPGENSNRGCGISLCQSKEGIQKEIENMESQNVIYNSISMGNNRVRTLIVQKYITNPLLIYKRKFDIRVYGMLTSVYGNLKGYFYEDGYLRTSSKEFQVGNFTNKYIHLTNDAIQKKSDDYGKFENGNKLSYSEFQKYLDSPEFQQTSTYANVNFLKDILPQIRHLVTQAFRSVSYNKIDPYRRVNSFEIFGFDFMIDDNFGVYLIEANTNPCIEVNSCPVLARIIPQMLDNAFRIAVDPLLPPPDMNFKRGQEYLQENKFSQVFDFSVEGPEIEKRYKDLEQRDKNQNNFNGESNDNNHSDMNSSSKVKGDGMKSKAKFQDIFQDDEEEEDDNDAGQ
eukprot:403337958